MLGLLVCLLLRWYRGEGSEVGLLVRGWLTYALLCMKSAFRSHVSNLSCSGEAAAALLTKSKFLLQRSEKSVGFMAGTVCGYTLTVLLVVLFAFFVGVVPGQRPWFFVEDKGPLLYFLHAVCWVLGMSFFFVAAVSLMPNCP